jgi:hypothetical protein
MTHNFNLHFSILKQGQFHPPHDSPEITPPLHN